MSTQTSVGFVDTADEAKRDSTAPSPSLKPSPSGGAVKKTRTETTLRSVSIVVHRYIGLAMAVFLTIAGLTGSLLAFYHDLDAVLNPGLYRASPPTAQSRPLDPVDLRGAVQKRLPSGLHLADLSFNQKPGEAMSFWAEPVAGAQTTEGDNEYFADPYTGEILGSRKWGDITQGTVNLMPFLYRLHYSLALDEVGSYLFGIIALLWTVDCFVGAYLTFPAGSRKNAPRSVKVWASRWKPSWLVRTSKLFSFVFTWHRASGLWIWVMLLVFAWSSVGLNLREVYHPVMRAVFSLNERASDSLPKLETPRLVAKLSFQEAHAVGQKLMQAEAVAHGFDLHEEIRLGYDAEHGTYRYGVRSSLDISERYPATTIWFDGDTGKRLAFEAPTGQAAGNTITTWLYHLHWGSIAVGGWPYQVFISLMGLAVAALSVSGVWVWWRKRAQTVRRRSRSNPA